jgi:hypothetical protein
MSPVAPIVHLLALLAGVFGGLQVASAMSPDQPGTSDEPGIVSTAPILGEDPNGWSQALAQIGDQLGDDEGITSLRATPEGLEVSSSVGEGIPIEEISASAPYLIALRIAESRPEVRGAQDLASLSMTPVEAGTVWIATLDPGLGPPQRYRALIPEASSVAFEVEVRPLPGS